MTNKRIQELATFFYGSNWTRRVPFQISLSLGYFAGCDLNKANFVELMKILSKSKTLKKDLLIFRESMNIS